MTTDLKDEIERPRGLLDLSHDLKDLVDVAASDDDVDDLLRRSLDWLARIVRYDLATVFTLDGGRLVARVARGPLAGPAVREHTLVLRDFPSLREALAFARALPPKGAKRPNKRPAKRPVKTSRPPARRAKRR